MRCVTRSGAPTGATWALVLGLPTLLVVCEFAMNIDLGVIAKSPGPMAAFLARFWVKPDWEYLPKLGALTLETLQIALVATIFACLLSFPVALLAARNTTPHPVLGFAIKAVAGVARALPDLLLALVLASALGLGNVPGVVALTVASVAYLVKAYADVLEVAHPGPVEGIAASGGGWLAQRTLGVVPQAVPDVVGLSLYGLDSNLRSAAILGAVGAGGIGFDLAAAVRHFRFDRLGMMILSVAFTVALVDAISSAVRKRLG